MSKSWLWLIFGVVASALLSEAAADGIPFPEALNRAAVSFSTLEEPINDALILGNGDMNGLLFAEGDDLVFRITKNDVWDARLDTTLDPPLPTLERLKELGAGEWPDKGWILPEGSDWEWPDSYHAHPYPCPRACGIVRIPGALEGFIAGKLDIAGGVARMFTETDSVEVYVAMDANVTVLEAAQAPVLQPIVSEDIPTAETGERDGVQWLRQDIPGDLDWPGMSFAVACGSQGGRAVVSVVTSYEDENPIDRAVALVQETQQRDAGEMHNAHADVWAAFWSKSGIALYDEVLERLWYRNLYFLRCVSKPGVVSPGLFAGLLDDKPAWHGDYHTNYNIQQTYWAAFSANQCELAEPYDRLIKSYLPRARWMAREIFDLDGAFIPHVLYAYEPSDPAACKSPNGRQYIHHVWGFTLGVTAFSVQPLWWHYKYHPDRAFLEEFAYPAVREVADFYAGFVEQCERDGDTIVLAPTVSPEHHGWTDRFQYNRNCALCIAYFRYIFDAAVEGAQTLGRDEDSVGRWLSAKAQLPNFPLGTLPSVDAESGGAVENVIVVDVEDASPIIYNIPVPATPVFPADQVGWFSPESERTLFRRTIENLLHNGNNAPVMLAVARARLDMPDAYDWLRTELDRRERRNGTLSFNRLDPKFRFNDYGHYTEMFGAALPITELLVQSVGDVIRLFPAWPRHMSASFRDLRTQGGFLVSADQTDGRITALTVKSTAGVPLRLMAPWGATEVQLGTGVAWESVAADDRGIIALDTEAGQILAFRPRPVWEQIRAEGDVNGFEREGDATVMRIQGRPKASTGYSMMLSGGGPFTSLEVELKGSANAQYYLETTGEGSSTNSGWTESPEEWTTVSLPIAPGHTPTGVRLYTWTEDGVEAWNAFRALRLKGSKGSADVDLQSLK